MHFKVIGFASLHESPDEASPVKADLLPDEALVATGVPDQNGWVNVNLFRIEGRPIPGWVPRNALDSVAVTPPRPVLNIQGFILNCIAAEREFNRLDSTAPWYVAADFLIARALIETGLANVDRLNVNDDGVGPLQVSSQEWKAFADNYNTDEFRQETKFSAADFQPTARDNPILQIWGAAARMHLDAKALATAAGGSQSEGPFIPSYLDLFHCYLVKNAKAAFAVRKAMETAAGRATPILQVLSQELSQQELQALLGARGGGNPNPGTVESIVARTEARLNEALKQAADLIKKHAPEEIAFVAASGGVLPGGGPVAGAGDPPWMGPARAELAAGVSNQTTPQRIINYFDHTDLRPKPTSIVAWCGAFASFCMANSGNDAVAASIPKASALAVSWKQWGIALPVGGDIPQGAIVVLSPSPGTTGTSGHVATFVRREGNFVVLLGGNQSKKVKESKFPASQIAKVCWFGDIQRINTAGVSGNGRVGPLNDADWAKYCEVLGDRESTNDYTKVNQFNYVGRWQFGAAALTEVGYVHPNMRNSDLPNSAAWTGHDGISSMQAWRSSPNVQDKAMLQFTRLYYKRLIRLGALTGASSRPMVGGMLAAAHLKGPGGALQFARGIVTADANGTTTKSYYKLLSQALGGTGIFPN